MATKSCPYVLFPIFLSCHSRGSGNPGQKKSLCLLDLRVKPEDDNTKQPENEPEKENRPKGRPVKRRCLCEKIRDLSGRTSGLFDAPVHKTMSAAFQS